MKHLMLNAFLKGMPEHLLYPGPAFAQESTVVNYVWVSAQPRSEAPAHQPHGLPPDKFAKAYENARAYPDTDFILWVDFSRLNSFSRLWLENYHRLKAPPNVRLRDLNLLPDYKNASDRLSECAAARRPSTRRPDLARLHVLRECLRTMKDKTYAMYCDLDVEDVRIGCPKSQRILSRHGMVHTHVSHVSHPDQKNILGVGYMIFRKDVGPDFLDGLIPLAERHVIEGGHSGICGALTLALTDWTDEEGKDRCFRDIIHPDTLLYPIGYKAPDASPPQDQGGPC